ncbi:hypothetical protein HK101_009056 [Irineochytrium annulatum]|nr:hypothetical protein HK101_009056 [Irineochytrium annulatum]
MDRGYPERIEDEPVIAALLEMRERVPPPADWYATWKLIDRPHLRQQLINHGILSPDGMDQCLRSCANAGRELGNRMVELAHRAMSLGASRAKALLFAAMEGDCRLMKLMLAMQERGDEVKDPMVVMNMLQSNRFTPYMCDLVLGANYTVPAEAIALIVQQTYRLFNDDEMVAVLRRLLDAVVGDKAALLADPSLAVFEVVINKAMQSFNYMLFRTVNEGRVLGEVKALLDFGFRATAAEVALTKSLGNTTYPGLLSCFCEVDAMKACHSIAPCTASLAVLLHAAVLLTVPHPAVSTTLLQALQSGIPSIPSSQTRDLTFTSFLSRSPGAVYTAGTLLVPTDAAYTASTNATGTGAIFLPGQYVDPTNTTAGWHYALFADPATGLSVIWDDYAPGQPLRPGQKFGANWVEGDKGDRAIFVHGGTTGGPGSSCYVVGVEMCEDGVLQALSCVVGAAGLLDALKGNTGYASWAGIVEGSGVDLSAFNQYTMFAPTDAAVTALGLPGRLGPVELRNLVLYSIVLNSLRYTGNDPTTPLTTALVIDGTNQTLTLPAAPAPVANGVLVDIPFVGGVVQGVGAAFVPDSVRAVLNGSMPAATMAVTSSIEVTTADVGVATPVVAVSATTAAGSTAGSTAALVQKSRASRREVAGMTGIMLALLGVVAMLNH